MQPEDSQKNTADRVLDAAEDIFAEHGYHAASLGDIADRVGIRSPSLYNHFRNKKALYTAVLERLVAKLTEPVMALLEHPVDRERILEWVETIMDLHHQNPNLARLLQHAALSGGPGTQELVERMVHPLIEQTPPSPELKFMGDSGLEPWGLVNLHNIVTSYITMAPLYKDVLGGDPFSEESLARQKKLIIMMARLVMDMDKPDLDDLPG